MKSMLLTHPVISRSSLKYHSLGLLFILITGLLGPLGFAPFHLPGCTLLSIALLYHTVVNGSEKHALLTGFVYGLAYFGFGVSWVIISIHDYGAVNYALAGLATLAFIAYLALYPALVCFLFKRLECPQKNLSNVLLFGALWCLSEYLRATLFTGFPWLLIGTSQLDTPLKYLLPIIGIYGVSFFCVSTCALLSLVIKERKITRYYYMSACALLIIAPLGLKNTSWTTVSNQPISIGAIQANLAMRDKWDEALFWNLLKYYEQNINKLLGKEVIILPESAIPLPASYLHDYLSKLHHKALAAHSAVLLGILQPSNEDEISYYNSMIALGKATGTHTKQQLVPFGEYIPSPFVAINQWLNMPIPNIAPGIHKNPLIKIAKHPIASLICYEIAYPELLRQQMPQAQWIVSISDNGWFGRSLASYQQLQMAQTLSLLTGRYQVLVNNDGLSSVIEPQGNIIEGLPSFTSGILQSELFPSTGTTPWIYWGDTPILFSCVILMIFMFFLRINASKKRENISNEKLIKNWS